MRVQLVEQFRSIVPDESIEDKKLRKKDFDRRLKVAKIEFSEGAWKQMLQDKQEAVASAIKNEYAEE